MSNLKTFNIFLQNGQKKPGLRRSFLRKVTIPFGVHDIVLEDGSNWLIYKEPEVREYQNTHGREAECLLSFQIFQDGEAFAIARLFKEEFVKEKGN